MGRKIVVKDVPLQIRRGKGERIYLGRHLDFKPHCFSNRQEKDADVVQTPAQLWIEFNHVHVEEGDEATEEMNMEEEDQKQVTDV